METRRDFLKKTAMLTGATMAWGGALPESIQKALAISPEPGSTVFDAEHIVILMQENRSFDHCYGALRGVRGFNDPRAFVLPNGNPVWLQTNAKGETYAPFRLDMHETKATWMGSLPHDWHNQVAARNNGRYDMWLSAKEPEDPAYSHMPLTMGHYTREDIPFYYAFADAFTVCDQHFCSSLTGTMPNRNHLWSGTIRAEHSPASPAKVYNEETDNDHEASWTTFPERLEDWGISWKIYQNELAIPTGFEGEERPWLSNYDDNPLEYFTQYQVRFSPRHRAYLDKLAQTLPQEIKALQQQAQAATPGSDDAKTLQAQIADKTEQLTQVSAEQTRWSQTHYDNLTQREKNIHEKAFTCNTNDPHYRSLDSITYDDNGTPRTVQIPKGDVLHQFRQDVQSGNLPTVSWLISPENFSDHPSAAWYGAWYVSEVLDILTKNPEVWKKTVFILNYDENDGYFDHVPPFTAPNSDDPATGRASEGLNTREDYVTLDEDKADRPDYPAQASPIGLGYRVPMVIASPWSRGGFVCSEVFDVTSSLRFMEVWLTHKTGIKVEEPNISPWRRAICGDLTSAFRPDHGKADPVPFPPRDTFIETIHKAQFKGLPTNYHGLTADEIAQIKKSPASSPLLVKQEPGIRPSCALPYELHADGALNADRSQFEITLEARSERFGAHAAGSPFQIYAYGGPDHFQARAYAVAAGSQVAESWPLSDFPTGQYHLRVDGPNGFHREFQGTAADPVLTIHVEDAVTGSKMSTHVTVSLTSHETHAKTVELRDNAYGFGSHTQDVPAGGTIQIMVPTDHSHGWYDFTVRLAGSQTFAYRYAGRVESGQASYSDPAMA